ncbi:hypothetical protein GCM10020367_23840 [Streptomyces sannanensis]|uniref:ABC transporter permease n=1 Tax=Streptomyces sannanensis TaxID=285536 RepID=A0ABP6SA90_9ACTN
MKHLISAELRRTLPRLLPVALLLLVTVGITTFSLAYQDNSHGNLRNVRQALAEQLTPAGCERDAKGLPKDVPGTPEQFLEHCLADLPYQRAGNEAWEREATHVARHFGYAQTPAGAPGIALGWLTTAPGMACVLLLAAYFTAGEWSRGTAVPLLLQEQRLSRVLLAKATTLFTWVLVTTATASAALCALAYLHTRQAYPLHHMSTTGDALAFTLRRAAVALPTLVLTCVVAVALASLLRSPARTVLVGVIGLSLAAYPTAAWLPGPVLADLMGLETLFNGKDHLWTAPVTSGVPALLMAAAWAVLLMSGARWAIRHRQRDLL